MKSFNDVIQEWYKINYNDYYFFYLRTQLTLISKKVHFGKMACWVYIFESLLKRGGRSWIIVFIMKDLSKKRHPHRLKLGNHFLLFIVLTFYFISFQIPNPHCRHYKCYYVIKEKWYYDDKKQTTKRFSIVIKIPRSIIWSHKQIYTEATTVIEGIKEYFW